MTPDEKIDQNLNAVLRAAGSALKYYSNEKHLREMREAMIEIMRDSYIDGWNNCLELHS